MQLLPTLATLKKVPFIVWLWIAQAFLLVNIDAIAPAGETEHYRMILVVYMILQIAFFKFAPKVPGFQMNLNQALIWFVAGFVVTVFVVAGFRGLGGLEVQTYAVGAPIFLVILHTLIVAVAEEAVFRGFLPLLITPVLAQIAFGVFHYSAYGGDMMSILIAIFAGFLFYFVMRKTNIWTVMGAHAGYNLVMLGVF